jgi:hypothetical protein
VGACDKKARALSLPRSASAALAERWRSGPTAIAVHRRDVCGARPVPHLQQEDDLTPKARIYTNISQNLFNPIRHKVHDP